MPSIALRQLETVSLAEVLYSKLFYEVGALKTKESRTVVLSDKRKWGKLKSFSVVDG